MREAGVLGSTLISVLNLFGDLPQHGELDADLRPKIQALMQIWLVELRHQGAELSPYKQPGYKDLAAAYALHNGDAAWCG